MFEEMRVADFNARSFEIFKNLFPESTAKKLYKRLNSIKSNEELSKVRIQYRESVNELIINLENIDYKLFHKSQSLIRHSSEEIQLLLVDRFFDLFKTIEINDPDKIISVPKNYKEFLHEYLISSWEKKFYKSFPKNL